MTDFEWADQLEQIHLGSGVAEQDDLLTDCMVETPHFGQLCVNRIDLVLGTKGAGKSSLFRIFGELLAKGLLEKHKILVVTGVETRGEPVFKHYAVSFNRFTETQFEIFWKAYILGLIYNKLKYDPLMSAITIHNRTALEQFEVAYERLHLLDLGKLYSPTQVLKLICSFTIAAIEGAGFSYNIEKGDIKLVPIFGQKFGDAYREVVVPDLTNLDTVLCIDALFEFAKKNDLSIWIMLDHLDIIFKRRSEEEARALRALLKVVPAFKSDKVSTKIFLRDDILDSISSIDGEPIAGLSHIAARSAKLAWTNDELCVLIMKRLVVNKWLRETYNLDSESVKSAEYSQDQFHELFPFKYKTQASFDWICSLVSDGRGIITPRDLIDLLTIAFRTQALWLRRHPGNRILMSIDSIKAAHEELSKHRRETVLQTEFSHLMGDILKFEHSKDKYTKEEIVAIFGEDWEETVSKLKAVGVLRFVPKKAQFKIAKIYAPGLYVHEERKSPAK